MKKNITVFVLKRNINGTKALKGFSLFLSFVYGIKRTGREFGHNNKFRK